MLENRLSDYGRSLEKDRRTLQQEIAANKEHGGSPAELEEKTATKNAVDLLIARREVLEARRTKLEGDMDELSRLWAPRPELQSKLSEIELINEKLLIDEMAREDRRDTADAAALQVVTDAARIQGPVWPVFLAGAAPLYLWWLAVLTFDLAFIWHLYIKNEAAEEYIEQRLRNTDGPAGIDCLNSPALAGNPREWRWTRSRRPKAWKSLPVNFQAVIYCSYAKGISPTISRGHLYCHTLHHGESLQSKRCSHQFDTQGENDADQRASTCEVDEQLRLPSLFGSGKDGEWQFASRG